MGDQAQTADSSVERSSSGDGKTIIPEGLKRFGRNLWSKTEEVAGNVAKTVKEKSGEVAEDLRNGDLEEKGKTLVRDGANIYQGDKSTGNETADQVIDFAKSLNPFGGLTDRAVDMSEKAVNGEEITGDDLKGAATEAGKSFLLPVPDQLRDMQRLQSLGERTGISDRVKDAVRKATEEEGGGEAVTTGEADEANGLPKVDIEEGGNKVLRFFRRHLGGDKN